jgi:hypothetical protein
MRHLMGKLQVVLCQKFFGDTDLVFSCRNAMHKNFSCDSAKALFM